MTYLSVNAEGGDGAFDGGQVDVEAVALGEDDPVGHARNPLRVRYGGAEVGSVETPVSRVHPGKGVGTLEHSVYGNNAL